MRRVVAAGLVLTLVVFAGLAQAQEKSDPTGTWKWSVKFGERTMDLTLKLKLEGDKLTGAMVREDQETPIEDPKFKDGELSFKTTRVRGDQKFVSKYTGKVTGDVIKGKTSFEREGQSQERDWEAKRVKEKQ